MKIKKYFLIGTEEWKKTIKWSAFIGALIGIIIGVSILLSIL